MRILTPQQVKSTFKKYSVLLLILVLAAFSLLWSSTSFTKQRAATAQPSAQTEALQAEDHYSNIPYFLESMRSRTKQQPVEIFVASLFELGAGANYVLTGETTYHPAGTNHFGTSTATSNLPLIADDYKNQFYGANPIPEADKLKYNDMSLINGGKFEIPGNWSATADHQEHKVGINCDVSASNVPSNRWSALTQIFATRGSPNYLDETNTAYPHWHLRF